jgi:hypothetical protein
MCLKVFVVGTENERVLAQIESLFGNDRSRYELTVINVLEKPDSAREERISATPCLVKESPPPRVVLVGDFSPTSVRWQLANSELVGAQNRESRIELRATKLEERENRAGRAHRQRAQSS